MNPSNPGKRTRVKKHGWKFGDSMPRSEFKCEFCGCAFSDTSSRTDHQLFCKKNPSPLGGRSA